MRDRLAFAGRLGIGILVCVLANLVGWNLHALSTGGTVALLAAIGLLALFFGGLPLLHVRISGGRDATRRTWGTSLFSGGVSELVGLAFAGLAFIVFFERLRLWEVGSEMSGLFGWTTGLRASMTLTNELPGSTPLGPVAGFVVFAILPPLYEEVMYRGYLQRFILERLPRLAACAAPAVVFALAHSRPDQVLTL